jgi:hypothetical protein
MKLKASGRKEPWTNLRRYFSIYLKKLSKILRNFRLFGVNAERVTFRKKLEALQTEPSCVVSVQGNMWGCEGIRSG